MQREGVEERLEALGQYEKEIEDKHYALRADLTKTFQLIDRLFSNANTKFRALEEYVKVVEGEAYKWTHKK
jgi:hypothetical protein